MAQSYANTEELASHDPVMRKLMHGKSSEERNAFLSMLKKDHKAHSDVTREYVGHWESNGVARDDDVARDQRKSNYASLVNNYYDLATDLYEEAWAQSFHLCRFGVGETLLQALARHEHYLAHRIQIDQSMTVLDVGCGVGKPAREIATFTGCNVVGLNNNAYQVERATAHAAREGLSDKVSFVKGDFMKINFPENSFSAAYAIEATVHAPSLEGVYAQIFRVVKPGGVFGVYEWVMTDAYDPSNKRHREIRLGIERGNGISNMVSRKEALAAMRKAGFEIEHEEDLAEREDRRPWYAPLAGDLAGAQNLWDLLGVLGTFKSDDNVNSSSPGVTQTDYSDAGQSSRHLNITVQNLIPSLSTEEIFVAVN
ncbi:hypothetical protein MBLNU13_g00343t1 [Cladosporium sp. NU13]